MNLIEVKKREREREIKKKRIKKTIQLIVEFYFLGCSTQ